MFNDDVFFGEETIKAGSEDRPAAALGGPTIGVDEVTPKVGSCNIPMFIGILGEARRLYYRYHALQRPSDLWVKVSWT